MDVDKGATKQVVRACVGFIEYRRIPVESQWVYLGNSIREEVLVVGTYQLKMWTGHALILYDVLSLIGRTLILYDVVYALGIRRNLLSVFALTGFGFNFSIHDNYIKYVWAKCCMDVYTIWMVYTY